MLQEELDSLQPGEVRKREPARPSQKNSTSRTYGQQAFGGLPGSLADSGLPLLARVASSMRKSRSSNLVSPAEDRDELAGTWENLLLDSGGQPLLERRDVWGLPLRENRGIEYGERKERE